MSTVVAVDVGGSGLRLVVRRDGVDGERRQAAGARVGAGGLDVAALAADARVLLDAEGVDAPDAVCWSTRGLLFLADPAEVLRAVAAALRARRTAVVSDAVANLVGALGEVVPGAVVAAGTGAVAFGSDFSAHWTRVDGWGHVLGDRGSAAWVGMEGLRAALRSRDGVGGGSPGLLAAAEGLLGPCEGWPRRVMTAGDAPEALASVAPLVTAAAETGDVVAAGVCVAAGHALGESLLAAAAGLARPRLVATGGLLSAPAVRREVEAVVAAAGGRVERSAGGALDGALVLAARLDADGGLPRHPRYVHLAGA
ncbi:hypothetical protein KMZ32_11360 [Phycicoccus sp. MAQZ13P-2]|uniref:BadF/BadG/BcrA/BcrD ATPase family protein n=1 Tax=Phycicoccus mangrovi TaxID=2840470 RepID=UPI001C007009|nr:BadF/BadG/BcrA/BcrD ATPase family protein [Phycicoccus mangrovi]MBT9256769.1 hypothetical protein [Phycicoccus mangrovi]MBT9274667.1 hypothetical protein [Phycicoccus mangrovi]